jgi:hypothetical protein
MQRGRHWDALLQYPMEVKMHSWRVTFLTVGHFHIAQQLSI